MKPLYKHIIWDWNGTLFDDAWLCVEIMNNTLKKRNMPLLTRERYQEILDFPIINYYRRLGFDFEIEPFEQVATEFINEYYQRWPECALFPEAEEVLRTIAGMGRTQSILSAAPQDYLEQAARHFKIDRCFNQISGLEDHYAEGKMENGRKMVAASGLTAREILLVGDTGHDYDVAQAIGADCALIPGGHSSGARLASCGCMLAGSLREVLELLM